MKEEPWTGPPENSTGFLAPSPITEGGLWGSCLPLLSLGFLFSRGVYLPLPGPSTVGGWLTSGGGLKEARETLLTQGSCSSFCQMKDTFL